jgi:hypothetical protein
MEKLYLAKSKEDAIKAIESQNFKMVQLDYAAGGNDQIELGRLSIKKLVATSFISSIAIVVKNVAALKRELGKDKLGYQKRNIFFDFPMSNKDSEYLQSLVSKNGDSICWSLNTDNSSITTTWE